jgi:hypothetical protein
MEVQAFRFGPLLSHRHLVVSRVTEVLAGNLTWGWIIAVLNELALGRIYRLSPHRQRFHYPRPHYHQRHPPQKEQYLLHQSPAHAERGLTK